MFWKKAIEIAALKEQLSFAEVKIRSLDYNLKLCRNSDHYKDSWKAKYFESLVEIQKANKGSRRLRRRLDKQILKNKESKT